MDSHDDFWKEGEMESVDCCPICGSADAIIRYSAQPDRMEHLPGLWTVRECLQCHSLYLETRPTPQAISKVYVDTYPTHNDPKALNEVDNGHSFAWRLVNAYLNWRYGAKREPALPWAGRLVMLLPFLRHQLDYFFRHLDGANKGRLLDIGCGNGQFLYRAKLAGWSVMGIEPDPLALSYAHEAGLDVREGGFDSFPGKGDFDVVTASHVIEHVHNPLALLECMRSHLQPGGRIWLSTPNAQSLGHRLFGKYWYHLDMPRHLHVFSRQGLQDLLVKAGFCEISFHTKGRGNSGHSYEISLDYAKAENQKFFLPPIFIINTLADFFPVLGEELIVTARVN